MDIIGKLSKRQPWNQGLSPLGATLESWSQGFLFCGLVILAGVTLSNMSKRRLHILILIELLMAMPRGTEVFYNFDGRLWMHSSFCIFLYASYCLHDIIAWLKIKPFLSRRLSLLFICSFLCTIPYWILEIYGNFMYYNLHKKDTFLTTRILEAPMRDPWWAFACCNLVYNIKKRYNMGVFQIVRITPRFGVMLVAMFMSIAFSLTDLSVSVRPIYGATGVNPFWKVSTILKCFCDTIILDDFKTALDKLRNTALGNSKYHGSNQDKSITHMTSSVIKSLRGNQPATTVDIERAESEIELNDRKEADAIYVSQTIAVEELAPDSDASGGNLRTASKEVPAGSARRYWSSISG